MAIEFNCEHCNHVVKAPDEAAGRQGKCPHCGGVNYIRRPPEEIDELDLTPLDADEEKRRKRQAEEDSAVQWKLLHERAVPGEPGSGRGSGGSRGAVTPPPAPTSKQLAALIVKYVDAMSSGKLDEAEEVSVKLARFHSQTLAILDDMASEDLSAYGLPTLPRPVLFGFLKQLRARL